MLRTHTKPKAFTVDNAIHAFKIGVTALILAEEFKLSHNEIKGVIYNSKFRLHVTKSGLDKINNAILSSNVLFKVDEKTKVVTVYDIDELLKEVDSYLPNKFPHFHAVINSDNYKSPHIDVLDDLEHAVMRRCLNMQKMWKTWGDIGLPHLVSSLQTLQRHIAMRMIEPLAYSYIDTLDNVGLSEEYHCEIFADRYYGAKLLGAWHAYLLSPNARLNDPKLFLKWLETLSSEEKSQYSVDLEKTSKVTYFYHSHERHQWATHVLKNNVVEFDSVPPPDKEGEKLVVIYDFKQVADNAEFMAAVKVRGTINHSSFYAGTVVDGAGRMYLTAEKLGNEKLSWVLKKIDNNSGHVKPSDEMSRKTLHALKNMGVDLSRVEWVSKWGTPGLRAESASHALKRLGVRYHNNVSNLSVAGSSSICQRVSAFLSSGDIKGLYYYITVREHKIRVDEAPLIVKLIKQLMMQRLCDGDVNVFHRSRYKLEKFMLMARSLRATMVRLAKKSTSYDAHMEKSLDAALAGYYAIHLKHVEGLNEAKGCQTVGVFKPVNQGTMYQDSCHNQAKDMDVPVKLKRMQAASYSSSD